MRKKFSCAQWLVQDNQELHYPYFIITKKHYVDRADVDKDWSPENTESYFRPIRAIKESRLTGEFAERIYGYRRMGKK